MHADADPQSYEPMKVAMPPPQVTMGWPDADTALLRPQASSSNAFDNPAQASSSSAFVDPAPPNSRPRVPKGLQLRAAPPLHEATVDLEEQSPTAELDAGCIGSPQSPADEAAGFAAAAVYRPVTPVPPHLNTRNSWHSGKKPPGADLLAFQFFTVGWLTCVDGPA